MTLHREEYSEYHEPTKDTLELARGNRKHLPSPYEVFMQEENIPIYKGRGFSDCRNLTLGSWKRLGGQGAFIELDGQAGFWGIYLLEVPAGGVLNPERHIYEEVFVVIEGRGSTEAWREGSSKKQSFEWQPWSRFSIPLNVNHRLVNATSSPALVIVFTTATPLMEAFPNRRFMFENPFEFTERFNENEDYFKPSDELVATESGLAAVRSNLIPDLNRCYLPLANYRGAGHRRIEAHMAGNTYFRGNHIAEYAVGRYSVAHYHSGGKIIFCLKGKGYTYNWPVEVGKRPWEAGKGHLVERMDYVAGGIVSAAPGGGNWWHQHFGCGTDTFREMSMGQTIGNISSGDGGEGTAGHSIAYYEEDPFIRKEYEKMIAKDGIKLSIPEDLYKAPAA